MTEETSMKVYFKNVRMPLRVGEWLRAEEEELVLTNLLTPAQRFLYQRGLATEFRLGPAKWCLGNTGPKRDAIVRMMVKSTGIYLKFDRGAGVQRRRREVKAIN
jgi:hypothetical protein